MMFHLLCIKMSVAYHVQLTTSDPRSNRRFTSRVPGWIGPSFLLEQLLGGLESLFVQKQVHPLVKTNSLLLKMANL